MSACPKPPASAACIGRAFQIARAGNIAARLHTRRKRAWGSCDGAAPTKVDGVQTCTAYNRTGGSGVYARAVCTDFTQSAPWTFRRSGMSFTWDDARIVE